MNLKIQDPVIESSMKDIRETLLQRILLSILAVGFIFIVVNFINEWILGSIQMTFPVLMLYIILLIIYVKSEQIPFQFRAYIIISVLFATGVVSSFTYGMIGLSILFYVGASYTAMLLLSRKETFWWMGMSLTIYLTVYALWVGGILTYDFSVEEYSVSITTMLSRLVAFIFFVGLMIFSQWMVNQFLIDKMNELKHTHDELVESDQQLQKHYEELALNREELKLKEEQYRSIVENTPDLIYALSKEGKMVTANSAMIRFLGGTEEGVIHQPISKLAERYPLLNEMYRHVDNMVSSDTPFQVVTRVSDETAGKLRTYHSVITPVKKESGELNLLLFKHHDVTELLLKDEKIEHLAYFDQLTGLSNRTHFEQVASSLIEQDTKPFAMIYFDLDHFKKINDSIGHFAGDQVLVDIAKRLEKVKPEGAILARLGGDEFVLLVEETLIEDPMTENIKKLADLVVNTVKNPVVFSDVSYFISASAGIVLYPDHGTTYEELMKNVDTAMYRAKNEGKNQWLMFNDQIKDEMNQMVMIESHLRHAFEYGEIHINFQPLVNSQSDQLRGFETLMRWQSQAFGAVPPDVFIPVLEQTGMIVEFGEWILRETVHSIKKWESYSNTPLIISVNISLIQLKQENFSEKVNAIIQEADITAGSLELEITESVLADDVEQITNVLHKLRLNGVRIALDDFGTGYSSLSYLRRFPLDTLKIDKTFSEGIGYGIESTQMIGSIIEMAHNIGLEVVAEGIENSDQVHFLKNYGCDYFQGFYYHKPMSKKDAERLLSDR